MMLQNAIVDRFSLQLHRETAEAPGYALLASKTRDKLKETAAGVVNGGRGRVSGAMSMAMLVKSLSQTLGRTVTDETGLDGYYIIDLKWVPDELLAADAGVANGPSIFTAVQEQLGLKLENRKVQVVKLVIDRVQRLSDN
jgi:uncharacterized protein (TIGR03435 family)